LLFALETDDDAGLGAAATAGDGAGDTSGFDAGVDAGSFL